MAMQYGVAQGLTIPTFVSTDSKTPTTPTNPVVTLTKDGVALAAAAGVVTVIADYGVHVALTAADMTAATIGVKLTSDNCDPVALSLVTEAGYTVARAANLDNLDAAISSIDPAGSGVHTVTVTVATAGGTVFEGVKVSMDNQTESLETPLVQYTDTAGQAEFHVGPGAWRALAAANGAQAGGYTDVTVDGAEAVTVTVVAASIPAPADPANFTLACFETKADDGDIPWQGVVVRIIEASGGHVDTDNNLLRSLSKKTDTTGADGLWSFELPLAWNGVRIGVEITRGTEVETLHATINTALIADGILPFASLSPS